MTRREPTDGEPRIVESPTEASQSERGEGSRRQSWVLGVGFLGAFAVLLIAYFIFALWT